MAIFHRTCEDGDILENGTEKQEITPMKYANVKKQKR